MPKTGLAQECVSEAGKALCARAGSTCTIQRDGYFVVSTALVILGSIIIATFIAPTARRLERALAEHATFRLIVAGLPTTAWRITGDSRRQD